MQLLSTWKPSIWLIGTALVVASLHPAPAAAITCTWIDGTRDIQRVATERCTLQVQLSEAEQPPEGFIVLWQGDGHLSFETSAGRAGRFRTFLSDMSPRQRAEGRSHIDTLVLGNQGTGIQFISVLMDSGLVFDLAVARISSERVIDLSTNVLPRVSINGGVFGGARFGPIALSTDAVLHDSRHCAITHAECTPAPRANGSVSAVLPPG
jgi:hypothetical protein